jgi:polyribonucleotide nucleotidyltransferase
MSTQIGITLAGRRLTIETGKLAKQANGAALVRYHDTVLLATATMSGPREGLDFFPLMVDFEEKNYAAGQIPVSFFRREGRPGLKSILVARMTDRPLRPLFPEGMRHEVQIIVTPFSADPATMPDVLSPIAASAALAVSDIPFAGPIGAVRVGLVEGEFVINPTYAQHQESLLDLVVAGTRDSILMVEAGAAEIPEETLLQAMEVGHQAIREIVALQEELVRQVGREKASLPLFLPDDALVARVQELVGSRIRDLLGQPGKLNRYRELEALKEETKAALAEEVEDEALISVAFDRVHKKIVRHMTLEEGQRVDGRGPTEIRPIVCEVGLFPRTHGSALFQRGETQALTITTLGSVGDELITDWLTEDSTSRYIHQYSFPPYSVGEVRPLRGPGRRDIGHGTLAERALLPVLPNEEDFPYTIRVVSEILESNGSSSMASVCGSSLSLMDAGVPLTNTVAGVAMGLMMENGKYCILTDIEGMEDACGDMDFKVAGTDRGITALQMDLKIHGLPQEILAEVLAQARIGLLQIRERMLACLSEPRPDLSPYAPRIRILQINPEKIGTVIGPGGKMINKIQDETGVRIDIEDDGRVFVAASDPEASRRACDWILSLVREVAVGEEYIGKVTRIMNFGAFVEILPGQEGLLHISRLSTERLARVEDAVKVGDELPVRVFEIDGQGRINLERTDLAIPGPAGGRRPSSGDRSRDRRPPDRRGPEGSNRRGAERRSGGEHR